MRDTTKSERLSTAGLLFFPTIFAAMFLATVPATGAETPHAVPSYLNDVAPILTRYGCNSGGCHGKLSGQRGFRLSLRGYAPELDHEWITREGRGRRISPAAPELSLLTRKAIGDVPHGGGRRLDVDSPAYRVLLEWIRGGAPGPNADDPTVVRLDVTPRQATLKLGETRRLQAIARYSDNSTRDVTALTRFDSNDAGMLSASAEGEVQALRNGETVVRAAFQGLVEIATLAVPLERTPSPAEYAARNNVVDEHVMNKLATLRIEPSPLCDDATFLRRASLDAIGTLPTPAEVRSFLADTREDRRRLAVERLLARSEFVDYWTLQLCDLLQNRKERDHDVRGAKGVRSFHAWVRKELTAGRPWNELARSVLTASGDVQEQPAVGYFIVTVGEKEASQSDVADSVAQAFLGTRIGCARCHNHPLEKYTQDDYYHFAAFFSRVALERHDPQVGATRLTVGTRQLLNQEKQLVEQKKKLAALEAGDAAGGAGTGAAGDAKQREKQLADAAKRISDLEKQIRDARISPVRTTQPRTGKPLPPRPLDRSDVEIEAGADPREAFARWATAPENEQFAGAMLNRVWKHFFAVGLVEPVDDLRATNPPSNAELWNAVRREFVDHGYDLKHLIRLILNSRTYQLASDTRPTNVHDGRFYSHYYARRLPAEVLLDALCEATGEPESFAGYPRGLRAIQIPDSGADSYFLSLFGRSARVTACACERENEVTLPQLLHLQNGDVGKKIVAPEGRLRTLIARNAPPREAAEELFLATLGRPPRTAELAAVEATLADANSQATERLEALADLFWALLNAKEFAFNH